MSSFYIALKSLWRNFSMTFASVLLVTLTLAVVGFVMIISLNVTYISDNVIKSLNMYVYVQPDATQEEIEQVGTELEAIEEVASLEFSTKDEELELLAEDFGGVDSEVYQFFSGNANPLSDVYIITVDDENYDMELIANEIREIPNVEYVTYGSESGTENFIKIMQFIQLISIVVAIILIVASMFIITNTIKLTITGRKLEIDIMRLVGSTKLYIQLPFMAEGFIIGALGGIMSCLILVAGYNVFVESSYLLSISSTFISGTEITRYLTIVLPIGGMIIGTIGSYLATRKYLRK